MDKHILPLLKLERDIFNKGTLKGLTLKRLPLMHRGKIQNLASDGEYLESVSKNYNKKYAQRKAKGLYPRQISFEARKPNMTLTGDLLFKNFHAGVTGDTTHNDGRVVQTSIWFSPINRNPEKIMLGHVTGRVLLGMNKELEKELLGYIKQNIAQRFVKREPKTIRIKIG